jgi:phage gp36-like protein
MAYISTSDLSRRLGAALYARLTDRVAGATADEVVAQQIVAEAEAEANSFLARRYATPVDLAAAPELAATLAARVLDLAEHRAWRSSPFVSGVPQRVEELYRQAASWFEAAARGAALLPAAAPPASGVAEVRGPLYAARPRQATAQELDGL